jgi:hypothetical protein
MTYDRLQRELNELGDLLARVHEDWWASWAEHVSGRLGDGSAGPDAVRAAFGGMGSLNDLIIHPINGHTIDDESIDAVNEQLDAARSRIYRLTCER